MDEEPSPSPTPAAIAFIITYAVVLLTCIILIYKNDDSDDDRPDMEPEDDAPSPPVPAPGRSSKRKAPPIAPAWSEECVGEIRALLRLGVPGMKELAKVYQALRQKYHADDRLGWADSCNAAFAGYGRDIQRRLEECEWELDRMDPCELWFVY